MSRLFWLALYGLMAAFMLWAFSDICEALQLERANADFRQRRGQKSGKWPDV